MGLVQQISLSLVSLAEEEKLAFLKVPGFVVVCCCCSSLHPSSTAHPTSYLSCTLAQVCHHYETVFIYFAKKKLIRI